MAAIAGSDLVSYARTQIGDPYVWGAEGPDAFDCSGLVEYVYRHFGLKTPRTTSEMQSGVGGLQAIGKAELQPGDLVLSKGWLKSNPNQGHVAIYAGNGKMIEAGDPVQTSTLGPGYEAKVTGYRRVPGVAGYTGTTAASGYRPLQIPTDPGSLITSLAGFATPGTITEALGNLGNAMLGIGQSVASVGQVAGVIGKALLPSNLLRGFLLVIGTASILMGIIFLSSYAKDS
jgi:cell wall-associated NlpC family hydrolase